MTTRYRQNRETILAASYQNQNILPLSETFDRAAFDALLAKTGCTRLRIYYGMDEDKKLHAIIVAVDDQNEDMLSQSAALTAEDEEEDLLERGFRCPDDCPPDSPLNTDTP